VVLERLDHRQRVCSGINLGLQRIGGKLQK
jgi:hypothetical protein